MREANPNATADKYKRCNIKVQLASNISVRHYNFKAEHCWERRSESCHLLKLNMKKILLLVFSVGLFGFTTTATTVAEYTEINSTTVACNFGQCRATAKSTGNQCKHCVSNSGDSFCYEHK